jgi:hypothetical protein
MMLQVLIRFPTGERKERRFHSSSTITSLYDYVSSVDCLKAEKYCLFSNFPRVPYGPEKHILCSVYLLPCCAVNLWYDFPLEIMSHYLDLWNSSFDREDLKIFISFIKTFSSSKSEKLTLPPQLRLMNTVVIKLWRKNAFSPNLELEFKLQNNFVSRMKN